MNQYPHILTPASVPEYEQNVSSGNWQEKEDPDLSGIGGACREEPSGSGRTVTMTDGKTVAYSSIIYMPSGEYGLNAGDKIEVKDEAGKVRISGQILRITTDRKNVRIWV